VEQTGAVHRAAVWRPNWLQRSGVQLAQTRFRPASIVGIAGRSCSVSPTVCLLFAGNFRSMRAASTTAGLVLLSLLTSCGPTDIGIGVVSGASIPIFHRTPLDMVMSAATGRDCSVVNLDKGEGYCRPKDRAPETPGIFAPDRSVYPTVGTIRRSY